MSTTCENEVAEILVDLPSMIFELEYCASRLPFSWGHTRKRSAIAAVTLSSSRSPLPPLKAEAPSPATPLSFSPSEPDENPSLLTRRRRRHVSLKRKREHYQNTVDELTKHNDLLQGEIKNVKSYFDKLKDFNLKLKARKRELSLGRNPNEADLAHEQPQLVLPGAAQHPLLMVNQTAGESQMSDGEGVSEFKATTSLGLASYSGGALGRADMNRNEMGPIEIPDLNVPYVVEEVGSCEEALEVNVMMDARQNSLHIYKEVKNTITNSQIRDSSCT